MVNLPPRIWKFKTKFQKRLFVTVVNVIEKICTEKTNLFIQWNVDVKEYNFDPSYNCSKCGYLPDEMACQTFDNLPDLETKISKDIKKSLLYITGYVRRKNCLTKENISNNTSFYFQEYGNFLKEINCDSFKLDNTIEDMLFCFIIFSVIKLRTCRNLFEKRLKSVSGNHHFN